MNIGIVGYGGNGLMKKLIQNEDYYVKDSFLTITNKEIDEAVVTYPCVNRPNRKQRRQSIKFK